MPAILAKPAPRTEANPHRADLDGIRAGKANLRIDANSGEIAQRYRRFLSMVREAMRRADIAQKAFAINAGIPESVVSEALSGARHLPASALWAQPDAFWSELVTLADTERQLTAEGETRRRAQQVSDLVRVILEGWTR